MKRKRSCEDLSIFPQIIQILFFLTKVKSLQSETASLIILGNYDPSEGSRNWVLKFMDSEL